VVVRPYFLNIFNRRGEPTSPANMPREMSSGESSPPYEPSQPPTASTSTPNVTKISLVMVTHSLKLIEESTCSMEKPMRRSRASSRRARVEKVNFEYLYFDIKVHFCGM
jgi:hypothetical protein